uniref:Protein phosphatase 1 regulatory subunit 12B n=1 Tax=Schistocephalus solidus TaxID=70667 RepID=A0A0X3PZU4_SCHSO
MLYGGPLGTYLSGYYAPGAGSTAAVPPTASSSASSVYPISSSGTTGAGGLTRSRSSRFRTPSSYTVSSTGAGAASASVPNNRSSFFTPQTSSDSKKRFTSTGSGSTSTTRYTRPSYTTTVSSTPLASSSMSPGLESSAGPDYKALYEAEKSETTQLRTSISAKQKQLDEIRLQLEDTRKAHHPADPDQRKAERQISDREEEMKVLEALRAESEKLKAEHRALTRVVSHLIRAVKPHAPTNRTRRHRSISRF